MQKLVIISSVEPASFDSFTGYKYICESGEEFYSSKELDIGEQVLIKIKVQFVCSLKDINL